MSRPLSRGGDQQRRAEANLASAQLQLVVWTSPASLPFFRSDSPLVPSNTFTGSSPLISPSFALANLPISASLGRTARAGASGSGILILAPFEAFFLQKRDIKALPLKAHPLAGSALALEGPAMQQAREQVRGAMRTVDDEAKSQYYGASLGFYKAALRGEFLSSFHDPE